METRTRAAYEVWFRTAGLVLVVTALAASLTAFYSRKFHLETGPAQWIWIDHPLEERKPVAFFAVRDVDVPADPPFVRIRIACDADWTLHLNGIEIAGGAGSSEPRLEVFDLSAIARKGETNRLMFAVRSATGVGGLLASVDYAPLRENDVVTDRAWSICRRWSPGVATGETRCEERPRVLGTPPFGRWNYPASEEGRPYRGEQAHEIRASDVAESRISRREIRVISGLALESATTIDARRFDFGPVDARGRITLAEEARELTVVHVRYGDEPADFDQAADGIGFVFAPGERVVTDPVFREFRFMAVVGNDAEATVVTEPSAMSRP